MMEAKKPLSKWLGVIPLVLGCCFFISCGTSNSDAPHGAQDTVRFQYVAWACECAQWATLEDIRKYGNDVNTDSLEIMSVYLEPANDSVILPDSIGFANDVVELYGYYLPEKGFPNNKSPGDGAEKARVFRYSNFRIIESHHYETMNF